MAGEDAQLAAGSWDNWAAAAAGFTTTTIVRRHASRPSRLQCACRVVHSHSYLQLQQVHVLRSLFICNGYCSKRPPSPVQVRCKCLTARRLSAGAEGFSVDAPAATARFCLSARIGFVSPGSRSCLVFVDGR